MKRNLQSFVVAAVLLLLLLTITPTLCNAQAPNWTALVSDSATCLGVDSNNNPVNRSYTFVPTNAYAYSWIKLQNVPPQNHTVDSYWYTPNGALYIKNSYTIPTSSSNVGWNNYCVWSYVNIDGYSASTILGIWNIQTYIDGVAVISQNFAISLVSSSAYINGVPYFHQQGSTWCGPTALQMDLKYFGVEKSINEIAANVWDSNNQTTYTTSMQAYPQQLGFNSTAFTGSIDVLKQGIRNNIPSIVLQRVSESDSTGHYRVVVGYDDYTGVFITNDPGQFANYNLTYSLFTDLWTKGSTFTGSNWTLQITPTSSTPRTSATPPSLISPSPTVNPTHLSTPFVSSNPTPTPSPFLGSLSSASPSFSEGPTATGSLRVGTSSNLLSYMYLIAAIIAVLVVAVVLVVLKKKNVNKS